MFSGIISGLCTVKEVKNSSSGVSLGIKIENRLLKGLEIGASVAVNGVCLTVVKIEGNSDSTSNVYFDVVPETLQRSNLSEIQNGSEVNIERSLKFGDEVGGHLCSGHVDGKVSVVSMTEFGLGREIEFEVKSDLLKFILEKGYVALNGASLTIANRTSNGFRVAFIPETLSKTNLGALVIGSNVNLEIDRSTQAIIETVERVLATTINPSHPLFINKEQ